MTIECAPTKFECYDTELQELLFTIEAFDEACATIDIKVAVDAHLWKEISVHIAESLKLMKLTGDLI